MSISAKIVADSISPQGIRVTTMELTYPRIIHAEIMAHRVFSRNAQSSRAIPVNRAVDLADEIVFPSEWGANKPGMSSTEGLSPDAQWLASGWWKMTADFCKKAAKGMAEAGLHKQWANRCLEWFSPIKVIVTATEWENFFWLRDDPEAAQPEIVELARQMKKAMDESIPEFLNPGEWHVPYIETQRLTDYGQIEFVYFSEGQQIDLETAKKISASACAQVSYRRLDTSLEKALEIYDKLFSGPKPHLSPVEHQCTPMIPNFIGGNAVNNPNSPRTWENGVTHMDAGGYLWSGNLQGFIQLRQTM